MKFKLNIFGIQLLLRVGLVSVLSLALGFTVVNKSFFFIPIVLVLALCLSIVSLYYYLKKTNENLYSFLLNLKHQDFQASFPKTNKNGNFLDVNVQYNKILNQFENQQELSKHTIAILESTIHHGRNYVIIYQLNGKVMFISNLLKEEFNLREDKHIKDVYKVMPFPCFTETNERVRKWVLKPKDYHYLFTESWHVEAKYISVYNTDYKICFFNKETFNQHQNIKGWLSFVKVVSHEIGNGITPIRSIAETISNDGILNNSDAKRVNKGLSMIIKQSDELLSFSERYRQLVQVPEIQPEKWQFSELLNELSLNFNSVFKENRILFTYEGDMNTVVFLDKQLMKQVFSNLIMNSIWALKKTINPRIIISIKNRKSDRLITFEDNGCGIAKDKRHEVFIPFYTTKDEGSGIGLSLTQQIIWKHNGRIFVESEPNRYTRFLITLNN